jgi:hypothetical protein
MRREKDKVRLVKESWCWDYGLKFDFRFLF